MTEAVAAVNRARLAWLSELRIYLDQTRGDCGKTNQEKHSDSVFGFFFCLVMKTNVKISPSMTFASFFSTTRYVTRLMRNKAVLRDRTIKLILTSHILFI